MFYEEGIGSKEPTMVDLPLNKGTNNEKMK